MPASLSWLRLPCILERVHAQCRLTHQRTHAHVHTYTHSHTHANTRPPNNNGTPPGCCVAAEDGALQSFWDALSHPRYQEFAIIWATGERETFRSPSGTCEQPSMELEGGKFLVNCTVNTKCATMNFPPTCCSAGSPVSGQRLRCIHGLQVCS